ncbi:MAG: orotate phosphoribosyltransferase-like protein [Thermoplasmatales archaeon]
MVIMVKSIEELAETARTLKQKGMTDKDIATEMHLSLNTVIWLLSGESKLEKAPGDVKIGWRSVGVYSNRIYNVSEIMADIIEEETQRLEKEVQTVVGITINGIPYATFISDILGTELGIYRAITLKGEGTFSSNYAKIAGKNIVFIDDVVSTGETVSKAINAARKEKGNPILVVVIANKTPKDEIDGVPLRALIRARLIK